MNRTQRSVRFCNKFSITISSITRRLFARRSIRHFTSFSFSTKRAIKIYELPSKSISFACFQTNSTLFEVTSWRRVVWQRKIGERERKGDEKKKAKIVVWISISLFEIKSILNAGKTEKMWKKSFLIFWFVFPFNSLYSMMMTMTSFHHHHFPTLNFSLQNVHKVSIRKAEIKMFFNLATNGVWQ